jgi:Right handed beta helix region/Secretion system C-terminal sorting domain
MKKFFILLWILICPQILTGQPSSGNGTIVSPYSGTLSANWTFNGTAYFDNLEVTADTFTINTGSTLYFDDGTGLTISGTGSVYAVGTSTSRITFDSDFSNGFIQWGQISFSSGGTGNSTLTYCRIQNGGSGIQNGGGISTATDGQLNVTYSDIEFNSATINGGAVYIGSGSPSFNYCNILNNYSNTSGGAVYISNGSPSFINCIISNNSTGSGGGIFISGTSSPRIDHCQISSNTATGSGGYSNGGGGIFIDNSTSPAITDCQINANVVSQAYGGGVYIEESANAAISNCLIYSNQCTTTTVANSGGGGITLGSITTGTSLTTIINCTIVNNTLLRTSKRGENINFKGREGVSIINSIIWGSSKSVFYQTNSVLNSDFVNCAIDTVYYSASSIIPISSFTNSFRLNSSNTGSNPAGPNFNATDGSDWSIKFISPCRDAGTTGTYQDYNNNFPIGPKDIGAYEVQYSRYTGYDNSQWDDAEHRNWLWQLYPNSANSTGDVVIGTEINPNYPSAPNVEIDKYLVLEPGAQASFSSLTNYGNILLESNSLYISSLLFNNYTGGGTFEFDMYLTGGAATLWHYISSPVTSIDATVFSTVGAKSVARYEENLISNDLNNGWVVYSGWHYNSSTSQWENTGETWSSLDAGKGYDYNSSMDRLFKITGNMNLADVTTTLSYNSINLGTPDLINQGYNLIGNPFTSYLDWDAVVSANHTLFSSDVESAIYFRKNGKSYYYSGGVTVPDDIIVNGSPINAGLIAPTQGFFVKSDHQYSVDLTIPLTARTQGTTPRFKKGIIIPLIRLQLDQSGNSDQTVVRFDNNATLAYDNMFDARKSFSTTDNPSISSSLGGIDYSINGIPFPESSISIPVIFNAPGSGSYSITAKQITGLDNYKVSLKDNDQNFTTDLTQGSTYTFTSAQGKFANRFILTISNLLTPVPEITTSKNDFNIYTNSGFINIQTLNDAWDQTTGEVKIVDLTGRLIFNNKNYEFAIGNIIQVPSGFSSGVYMVEITSGYRRFVSKVIVK